MNEVLPGFDYNTVSFGLILVNIRKPYTGVARSFQYRTDRAVLLKIWNDNHSGSQVRGSNTKLFGSVKWLTHHRTHERCIT